MCRVRRDAQIAGLEILAIALGVSSFAERIRGRRVRVFSDNTVAEGVTRRGSARCFDHNSLAHAFWTTAMEEGWQVWIDRVPTKDNIADLPSRECYDLLGRLGAERVAPRFASIWWTPEAWHGGP